MPTSLFYIVLYAGGIVFLAGSIVRAMRYASQPLHLRWEIYPVPHGYSGELKVMVPEIAFLKGLWEYNRPMWYVSYPFHLGLYLVAASVGLLLCIALCPQWLLGLLAGAAGVSPHHLSALLAGPTVWCGNAGAILGLAGALGLLVRRLTNRELRMYSVRGDFLNLILFIVTFTLLLAGYWMRPAGAPGPFAILSGAARFDTAVEVPGLLGAGMAAAAILLAYIPMTHMAHFIAKYFTYHKVRWDEHSSKAVRGKMAEYLMYRPTWAAPHVGADGKRTWGEVATTNPTKGGPK